MMDLENIMLNERSHAQKSYILLYLLYDIFRIGKSIEKDSRLVVIKG